MKDEQKTKQQLVAELAGMRQRVAKLEELETERKRVEEVLRESEAKYSALVENSRDGIVILQDGVMKFVNTASLEIVGYTPEELLGIDFLKVVTPEDREMVMKRYADRMAGKEVPSIYEMALIRKDGITVPVEVNATFINYEGRPADLVVIRDITERKRAEEELRRSNQELEHFAYIASHDLQEPLRMVSSYTQLLAQRYKDKLDADADEFIHYVEDGVSRMRALINGLLVYSRVGTSGAAFELTDCEAAFDCALTNLQVAVDGSGAVITHHPLPVVMADASQLTQVFQNLIGNAIKFCSQELPRIHVAAEPRGNEWLFSIRDNGIGIDPQYHDRIFDMSQRLHSRTKYPGSGIGLAICDKVVKRHGGRIWVESQTGKGATFYFTIPIKGDRYL
ncbi:Adaptive-response sensory-kinase SasA [subsurface metagenome]